MGYYRGVSHHVRWGESKRERLDILAQQMRERNFQLRGGHAIRRAIEKRMSSAVVHSVETGAGQISGEVVRP